jgi:MoxR-like ATPase
MSSENGTHGANINGQELFYFLEKILESNLLFESETGRRPTPICIWGTHGLGKTEIAMELARTKKWKLAYCAPAQFEEMGDLHGLPFKFDPDPNILGDERTVYMPPEWVPTDDGPGILLLDDINRADDRILRGTMQLLQNFEMFSWSLPPNWQIIVTANPDSGDYSVTPMDEAMLTRMIHVTLKFDEKAWAEWALNSGVDERGVNFVLTYPETVTLRRTTPRTLVQFFSQTKSIPDLIQERQMVQLLAKGCLDSETAESFLNFIEENFHQIPSPELFLETENTETIQDWVKRLTQSQNGVRLDLINTVMSRIIIKLKTSYIPQSVCESNLIFLLKTALIPLDLRYAFHQDLFHARLQKSPSMMVLNKVASNQDVLAQFVKMI